MRGGTELAVTAIQYGGVWYQVETSAGTGWINRTYTVKRGDFTGITHTGEPADTGPQPSIPGGAPYLVVNTAYLNVRTGPGVGHNVLTTVPGGTELQVTAIDSGGVWYQVETSAGTGWVNSNYTVGPRRLLWSLTVWPAEPARGSASLRFYTARAVVNTAYLNIRSGAGINNSIVATVPGGTVLRVLGLSRGRGWSLVEGSFGQGWLNNFYTVFRGDFSQVRVVN